MNYYRLISSMNKTVPSTLPTGLVSVYKAESNANDSLGTNNGTAYGGLTYVSGKSGNAFSLNGTTAYVDMGDVLDVGVNSWSYSIWFNTALSTTEQHLFAKALAGGLTGRFSASLQNNKVKFFLETSGGVAFIETVNSISINTWYNVVFVVDRTSVLDIYLNGTLQSVNRTGILNIAPYSTTNFNTNCPFRIGAYTASNNITALPSFNGKIDEFGIWNRVLTAIEVTELYKCSFGRFFPFPVTQSVDSDVCAFISNASITDITQQSAINTLVADLKGYGIWTKMKAIYPFVGGVENSHKYNLIDARDDNSAYRLTFSGGGTHTSDGYVMNGIDSYANTFFNPSLISGYNDNHSFGLYLKTQTPIGNGWHLGYGNTNNGDPIYGLAVRRNGTNDLIYDSGDYSQNGRIQTTITDAKGFWCGNSRANNDRRIFKNGTELAQRLSAVIGTTPNDVMTIGAVNGTSSTPKYYLSGINSFTFFASSLSAAELTNLNTAVTSFQTTLGRQN